jgi:hypothetical protein
MSRDRAPVQPMRSLAACALVGHCGDTNDIDFLMKLADEGSILGMDRSWGAAAFQLKFSCRGG